MARVTSLDEAYAHVVAAGASPDLWPRALAAISHALGAAATTLEVFPRGQSVPVFFRAHGIRPISETRYLAEFAAKNPRVRYCGALGAGQIGSDYDILTDAEMDRDPFYAEFLAPDDLRYFAAGVLHGDRHDHRAVVVHRSPRQGATDAALSDGLRRLMPVLRDSLDVTMRLGDALNATADMMAALDWLADGVALIDRQGNVVHLNATLAAMLRAGDGLRFTQGMLDPVDGAARRLLANATANVVHSGRGGSVLVPRRGGAPPYLISLRPAPTSGGRTPGRAVAFIFVTDTAGARPPSAEVLVAAFGLTDAEAQLALALHAGISPLDHARARGISNNTVYTHLRRLKEKTGTHRIPELLARLDAVRGTVRDV
jgi:DNA-binding CsgD family transcriptional regulator/PAS domain-containing protein